jgi:hypothetical protein
MTLDNPYEKPGHWYKGQFHCHSTESDGGLSPEKVVSYYRTRGYDFLGLSDHSVMTDTTRFSSPDFLTLGAEELSHPHMVGLGLRETIEDGLDFQGQVDAVRAQGALPCLVHPHWMGLHPEDVAKIDGLWAIEVYNDVCQELIGKGTASYLWDDLLMRGVRICGVANDDAHLTENHPTADKAWTVVKAEALTHDALLEALSRGACYGTRGPQIYRIAVEDDELAVECSAAAAIRFIGPASRGFSRFPTGHGSELERVRVSMDEFARRQHHGYIRVEVEDRWGRIAWANPIWIES